MRRIIRQRPIGVYVHLVVPGATRSLWPREHGAYGQLLLPLVLAFVLVPPTVAAVGFAIAAVAGFLSHEPLLVLLGHRGPKARSEAGRRAARLLLVLAATGALAGGVALALAETIARGVALIPFGLAAVGAVLAALRAERTTAGEIVIATALASAALPVAVASGVELERAFAVWAAWSAAFAIATLAVRATIARAKAAGARRGPAPVVVLLAASAVLGAAAGLALVGAVSAAIPIAVAPVTILALVVALVPIPTRRLHALGWSVLVSTGLTLVVLAAGMR